MNAPLSGSALNVALEIHDSRLAGIILDGPDVILRLDPAYLHLSAGRPSVDAGTGWLQALELRLQAASLEAEPKELPLDLWEGVLVVAGKLLENIVPLPIEYLGPVHLDFTTMSGEHLEIRSHDITISRLGEPRYVEDVPGDQEFGHGEV